MITIAITSPMFPPTPCIDRAEPRRSGNRREMAAMAGKCHSAVDKATSTMPASTTG